MKLLIVEDEEILLQAILDYFKTEVYVCEIARNYTQALDKILIAEFDCIVVDVTLPDGSGFDLIQELKARKSGAGIITISAKGAIDQKIKGLDLGSDDYIVKPFHLSELNARIKALYRRKKFDGNNLIVLGEIKIDLNANDIFINDQKILLTPKEYQIVLFFIANKNKVVTRTSLTEHLREDDVEFTSFDFIYTHIANLRRKMLEAGCGDYIKSVYGIGYKFELP